MIQRAIRAIWLYVKNSFKFLDVIKGLHQIKIIITITNNNIHFNKIT